MAIGRHVPMKFHATAHCKSLRHCAECRADDAQGRAFRVAMLSLAGDPLDHPDFSCPVGKQIVPRRLLARQPIPAGYEPRRDLHEGGCNCTDTDGTENAAAGDPM